MSKRPSSDLNSTKSKRPKRTLETSSLLDSQSDASLQQSTEQSLTFDEEDFNELKTKTNRILNSGSNEQKINDLTNLFKEIINSNDNQKLSLLYTILVEYLSLNSLSLDDKLVSQISLLLALQIDSLPLIVLKNSIDLLISQIKSQKAFNEKCIDQFVEIFKHIQKLPTADLDKHQTTSGDKCSGNDYIHKQINELFSSKWTQSTALNILNLVKAISLDQNETKILLTKLFDINEIIWPNVQVPTLINSVLSLSCLKQNRTLIFEKILAFFNQLRKNPSNQNNIQKSDFIDAETLSILHIIHLVKTDQNSTKDLIKIFKTKLNRCLNELVQPFTFGLILSLVKVLSKDGMIELLRQIITRIFESEMKYQKYFWVAKCFTEEEKTLSSCLLKPSKCRLYSSEHILSGLIKFLFDLLDNDGVRMTKNVKPVGLKEKITFYASEMIRDLFRNVIISREEILNQLTERIFSSSVNKSIVFIDQLTILIQSEPASSFQDYFRKFKSRLDHMIYMTPIVALEFLTSIKPLLKYDSIYKDNLIITLKKSIYQSDFDVRKVGLNGLICLLTQTKLSNFLPSSQASQSMSLSQSQSQISRINMSQEKNSEKNCLEIFLSLRRCLTQQDEIRSRLYQSCCSLVAQNTTLIGPTLNLLLTNFENYLIKTAYDVILDFGKCIKVNSSNEIELVEPLDIMMHALHLCDDKFIKMTLQAKFQDQLDEDIKKHSDLMKTYFDQLKQNFLSQNSQFIIDTYMSQVSSTVLTSLKNQPKTSNLLIATQSTTKPTQKSNQPSNNQNSTDLSTSMAFYQCLLGSVEILIEHFYSLGYLKTSRELYKKFNQMYDLVHKKFTGNSDDAKKKTNQTPSKSTKKKPASAGAKKKGKQIKSENKENLDDDNENEETINNEDDEIKASAIDQSKVAELTTIEQQPLLESTTNNQNNLVKGKKNKENNSKKNNSIKFNYIHRISYSCLQNVLISYFADEKKTVKVENSNDYMEESLDEFLVHVKVDESFHEYIMKVLNQQLELILNETNHLKTNAKSSLLVYDPESYDDKELFKYLFQIWKIFWKHLNNFKCSNNDCSSQNYYCEECIKSKSVYIKILSQVWKIVSLKFNPKLKELFSISIFEESQNDSISQSHASNCSTVAVGVLDHCRQFIDKCLISTTQYIQNSYKLAIQLVDFMYEVSSSVELKIEDFSVLFRWIQTLSNERDIRDQLFVKSLFKFFIFITWNKNSSAALMKYLCNDLIHVYGVPKVFKGYLVDLTPEKYFACLTDENSQSMISLICEELSNQLTLVEWFISFKTDTNSIHSFYKQLNCILECIKILLIIDLPPTGPYELQIRILCKFYGFMIIFCKSIPMREVSPSEETLLKLCVDVTAKQLQNPLNYFIRTIQNAKSSIGKEKDLKGEKGEKNAKLKGKDSKDTLSSAKIIKCTKMIPNLVYLYEQYEQQLKLLNKHFQNRINFTEFFEIRLRDFKITLPSGEKSDDEQASLSPEIQDDDDETNNENNASSDEENDQDNNERDEAEEDEDD